MLRVRPLRWLYWLGPVTVFGAAGCQDSETGRSTAAEIGQEGGYLGVAGATLVIPEGALDYRLRVELVRLATKSVTPPITTQLAGPAFALRPHGTRFRKAATLTLPYHAAADEFVYAVRLDTEQDRTWTFLPGSGAFDDEREATFDIDGFSVYAMVRTKRSVDFSSGGSGGTGSTTTGEGGGAGEIGAYSYDRFCERICAARAALACTRDATPERCTTSCIENPPDPSDDCYAEYEALNQCVWENIPTAFECGSDGRSAVKNDVCPNEQADAIDCQGL